MKILHLIFLLPIDETSFRFVQDDGSEYKKIFSRVLWCKGADLGYGVGYNRLYVNKYKAYFKDQGAVEFQTDARIAKRYTQKYAEILGRIPSIFRSCLKVFQIIKGLLDGYCYEIKCLISSYSPSKRFCFILFLSKYLT